MKPPDSKPQSQSVSEQKQTEKDIQAQLDALEVTWLKSKKRHELRYRLFGPKIPTTSMANRTRRGSYWMVLGCMCFVIGLAFGVQVIPMSRIPELDYIYWGGMGLFYFVFGTLYGNRLAKRARNYEKALARYTDKRREIRRQLDSGD